MAQTVESEQSAGRAVSLADAALASQARSGDPANAFDGLHELRLLSLRLAGTAMMNQGKWDEAQALLQQALDEARARGLLRPQTFCLTSCSVPCDHVPVRSWPLFRAREVMPALMKSLAQEQRS